LEILVNFYKQIQRKQELDLHEIDFLMQNITSNHNFEKFLEQEKPRKRSLSCENLIGLRTTYVPKKEISHWGKKDTARWLKCQGLEQYSKLFIDNSINGKKLVDISSSSLLDLGINNFAHRKKIVQQVALLKEQEQTKSENPVFLWTPGDVALWVKHIDNCKAFKENVITHNIGGAELCGLDPINLTQLGVSNSKINRILVEIGGLKQSAAQYLAQKEMSTWSCEDLAGLFVIRKCPSLVDQIKKVKILGKDLQNLDSKKLRRYGFSTPESDFFLAETNSWKMEVETSKEIRHSMDDILLANSSRVQSM